MSKDKENNIAAGFANLLGSISEQRKSWLSNLQLNGAAAQDNIVLHVRAAFLSCAAVNKQTVSEDYVGKIENAESGSKTFTANCQKAKELMINTLYEYKEATDLGFAIYYDDTSAIIIHSRPGMEDSLISTVSIFSLNKPMFDRIVEWLKSKD